MNDTVELLRRLCEAHGVSGYEDDVREIIRERLEPLGAEMKVDVLGNLVVRFPAPAEDVPVLLLDAHMDEVGLVVSYVESNGFLRFALVGGWDERVLPAHAVNVKTEDGAIIRGVIGTPPPHILKAEERNKPFQAENLFIDIGARSAEEVKEMGVRVGDSAVPSYPFESVNGEVVIGKALDDRAGCTVSIRVLEELFAPDAPALPVQVVALFSTFEEVGARGAHAAAYEIDADIALVLEGTVAADCPGVPGGRCPSRQGKGPALTLMDRSAHLPRKLVRQIEDLAAEIGVPCQLKTPIYGGTNAARIHMTRAGVPTAVMSVPCRYIHSPNSMLRLEDLESTVRLAAEFIRRGSDYLQHPVVAD